MLNLASSAVADRPRPSDAQAEDHIVAGVPRGCVARIVPPRDGSRALREAVDRAECTSAQDQLRRLESRLRQAQRLEVLGALAGGITHDFNNILGAILGYAERALRDTPRATRLHRDLESIIAASERGRALVDRVLTFTRGGVAERTLVHVERVVREALDHFSAKLPPGVRIEASLSAGRAALLGDPTQVYQVLMNLACNAAQAMPHGGTVHVSLSCERIDGPRTVSIGAVNPGEFVVLRVVDSGCGIPPEILDRIFEPFFTTKDVGAGTGLGLSLVSDIVNQLGGAINVSTVVRAGSTFTVYLPCCGDAREPVDSKEPALARVLYP